ncbi:MAG: zinc ribbon domain-containing protein [Chloroflexota bacterium]|nr:zinc ribbon domain-containing protein [Chloroflexota bacterium]
MPTYEYLSPTCSHRFETWQKMADEPLTVCPECGKHIRRVFYPAGIVFKGSGFYKTDHPVAVAPHPNGNDAAPNTDGDGKSETSAAKTGSESKPAESSKDGSSTSTPASEHKTPTSTATK